MEMVPCNNCGQDIYPGSKYCFRCSIIIEEQDRIAFAVAKGFHIWYHNTGPYMQVDDVIDIVFDR